MLDRLTRCHTGLHDMNAGCFTGVLVEGVVRDLDAVVAQHRLEGLHGVGGLTHTMQPLVLDVGVLDFVRRDRVDRLASQTCQCPALGALACRR
ncbi:hypothetical protein D3C77_714040 [compost metagenome]